MSISLWSKYSFPANRLGRVDRKSSSCWLFSLSQFYDFHILHQCFVYYRNNLFCVIIVSIIVFGFIKDNKYSLWFHSMPILVFNLFFLSSTYSFVITKTNLSRLKQYFYAYMSLSTFFFHHSESIQWLLFRVAITEIRSRRYWYTVTDFFTLCKGYKLHFRFYSSIQPTKSNEYQLLWERERERVKRTLQLFAVEIELITLILNQGVLWYVGQCLFIYLILSFEGILVL